MTERRDVAKFCASLTSTIPITAPALQHGRSYEAVAISKYEEVILHELIPLL